jgi:death-on-curing family protein
LSLEDVVALHDVVIERTGSPPCPLLHPDKLESAINRPRWAAHYEGASIIRQAVLLAVGISQSQAFEEGNKRAGFASADAFLRLNGMAFVGDSIVFAEMLIAIAESPAGAQRDETTERFEQWLAAEVVVVETR